MKWQQLEKDDGLQCLEIQADWSELADDYDDILAGYRTVRLPGFRPGKVPRSAIEQRFQQEISEQLTRQVAQRLGREAVREAGIEVLGQAEVEEIACRKGEAFTARVRFYPMPEFGLPALDALRNGNSGMEPRDQISLRLLEQVSFDLPDRFVQEVLVQDDADDCKPGSAEWEGEKDRIKLMLILKKIARQEGIEVDQRDVDNRITEKAEEFATSVNELQAELSQGDGMKRLKELLLAESTLSYLAEKIS